MPTAATADARTPTTFEWARAAFPRATGYFIEHRDGFRTAIFLVGIQDFNYAGLRAEQTQVTYTVAPENIYYDHCHMTPAGNRLMGQRIADFLRGELQVGSGL